MKEKRQYEEQAAERGLLGASPYRRIVPLLLDKTTIEKRVRRIST